MATTKPRMMLTLEPQTYATFKHFAALSGTPVSTIVSQLLNEARPQFEKLGVMLQQARDLQTRTKEQQSEFLAKIDVLAHRTQASVDLIQSDLVTTIESAPKAVASAASVAVGARPKSATNSLIHTNNSPKSTPKRVPARSVSKKRGAKRETT